MKRCWSTPRQGKGTYLTTFWGVKLDSHKWFKMAPFQVALNWASHSDLESDSDENPADPTKINCLTCSGCYNTNVQQPSEMKKVPSYSPQNTNNHGKTITLSAYLAATYPPNECPSNMKLLRFFAFRHSSKESINHASVSTLPNLTYIICFKANKTHKAFSKVLDE